jgi:hypothetical protein
MKGYTFLLPAILEQTAISPRLTTLTIESRNIYSPTSAPYPFEELANAYLGHLPLSQNLVHLSLKVTCRSVPHGTPSIDWGSIDRLLSDEGRFPNLETVQLALTETYQHLPESMRNAIKEALPASEVQKAQEIRNAFEGSERRGFGLEVVVGSI